MEREKLLKRFLTKGSDDSLKIKKLDGSSRAEVFTCNGKIYKIGPLGEAKKEIAVYNMFRKKMKEKYNEIFPSISLLLTTKTAIWEVERMGETNLEDVFLNFSAIKTERAELEQLNRETLRKIEIMFDSTNNNLPTRQKKALLFLKEIFSALEVNLKKARIKNREILVAIKKFKKNSSQFISCFVSSLAHKDLTVGNIVVNNKKQTVRFIDPRHAIPHLEKSSVNGNIVFDLTGYYISILRKERELAHDKGIFLPAGIPLIIKEKIEKYEKEKVFTEGLKEICMLVWYSIYLACKCNYCMSKQRIWLYNEMLEKFKEHLKKLQKLQ